MFEQRITVINTKIQDKNNEGKGSNHYEVKKLQA